MNEIKINWGTIILVILIVIVLFFLFRLNNIMTNQSRLLIGMAEKLGVSVPLKEINDEEEQDKEQDEEEITPAQDKMIIKIAKRIFDGKQLTKKQNRFYKKFKQEIDDDVLSLKEKRGEVTAPAQTNEEKEIREDGKDTQEKESEDLNFLKMNKEDAMLSLFEDGIPKISKTLIQLFADKRKIRPNGGLNLMVNKLVKNGILKKHNDYYCLTEWFDGNKLKKEYKEKI